MSNNQGSDDDVSTVVGSSCSGSRLTLSFVGVGALYLKLTHDYLQPLKTTHGSQAHHSWWPVNLRTY